MGCISCNLNSCIPCNPRENGQYFYGLEEEKLEKNTELGLKIYICGNLPQKKKFIEIFKQNISDSRYFNRGDYEFKTD
jgi:hypothetical protein